MAEVEHCHVAAQGGAGAAARRRAERSAERRQAEPMALVRAAMQRVHPCAGGIREPPVEPEVHKALVGGRPDGRGEGRREQRRGTGADRSLVELPQREPPSGGCVVEHDVIAKVRQLVRVEAQRVGREGGDRRPTRQSIGGARAILYRRGERGEGARVERQRGRERRLEGSRPLQLTGEREVGGDER